MACYLWSLLHPRARALGWKDCQSEILTDGPFLVDFYIWLNLGDPVAKQNNGFNGPFFIAW
jgi:hypothetical protein